jgi:hypothetical protein
MDTITNLTNAAGAHIAPSHSHIYSGTPLAVLPRDIQTKLTDLHAYLSLSPNALFPDQESPAARWASPFRLFPHIRAPDTLAGYDGLALNPPETARGKDPMSARWRVLNRVGRETGTHERRQYLPSLIALITALELIRHLRACVGRRGADWVADAARQERRQREAERRREPQTSPRDSKRRRLRRKRGQENLHSSHLDENREIPMPRSAPAGRPENPIPLPRPLSARIRKLERCETRLRWQVAMVAEALWGNGPRSDGGDVQKRVRQLVEQLDREGFLMRYDWSRGFRR